MSKVISKNNLLVNFPNVAAEWDINKNNNLFPEQFPPTSREKIWWICANDKSHTWKASILSRTKGKGSKCPYCANRIVNISNCLQKTHPGLAMEWNYQKNTKYNPTNISAGSNTPVWWVCKDKHEWKTTPSLRSHQKTGCPYCKRKKAIATTSIFVTHPELVSEWHPNKNGNLTPKDVLYGSGKKVWWRCRIDTNHIWVATPNSRTNRKSGCPKCSKPIRKVHPGRSLAYKFPKISKEWDIEKNNGVNPINVSAYTHEKHWWICNNGHTYECRVSDRTKKGNKCPYCSGKRVTALNSISSSHDIVNYWHLSLNGGKIPSDYHMKSNQKIWLKCREYKDHIWNVPVSNITRFAKVSCPFCSNRRLSVTNNVLMVRPDLAKEWHPSLNHKWTPENTIIYSTRKIWWVCSKYDDHIWTTTVNKRMSSSKTGCPFCYNYKNKSEEKLFNIVKEIFINDEVARRARPKFLMGQEIDVFLMEKKLGFEYQGQQHFQPIDFFGGEKGLEYVQLLDKKKLKLCVENNITLIYINYFEVISKELILNKLMEANKKYLI
jgi:glutaredoxin/DNA-directed RNA polymerase subunit RPC12/RpoP